MLLTGTFQTQLWSQACGIGSFPGQLKDDSFYVINLLLLLL